ncbi:hypothetical protein JZ751_000874 [Albula glossodonta]|uniref:Rho-GAP domain-containing protein n=1 Tax=Albula glossodonta TaxID=121402 RepID=A0A8T2PXF1_9TELE|nr:hypothetical protein JZ751_000874 [Albula glossodonta]
MFLEEKHGEDKAQKDVEGGQSEREENEKERQERKQEKTGGVKRGRDEGKGKKLDTGNLWLGKQCYQGSGRMISQEALRLPPEGHSVSQNSLDLSSMDDYWSEVKSIEENGHTCQEELLEQSVDEAELEEAWLQGAGLSTLVSGTAGDSPAEALLSTLTRTQAALVKKRLDNYTQTMRKRNKQPIRHVRDVFSTPDTPPGRGSDPVSPVSTNTQPLSKLPLWTPTQVEDLTSEDMKKIGYFSLIELTTFYDALGIELKRSRTVRGKARETGIFGVPLATLLENDQKKLPGSKVPLIFRKLLSKLEQTGLQTEGILRVPGSASRVKHLRQELEAKFYEDRFDWEQVRHNDAAGLLKIHQIQALHLLILLLPEPNRDTLKALLEFLRKVVANEEKNRMSLWNVSMIVAPNLFIARGKNAKLEEMQGAAGAAHLVRLLITNQDLLWTVPCFLISQLRKLNEASVTKTKPPSSEKTKRKLLRRWTMDRDKREKTQVSMAILLDSGTKAKDVMARFDCENGSRSSSKKARQYLFEVGGNMGERCLDPETHLLDLYRVNPNCTWVFKPRTAVRDTT